MILEGHSIEGYALDWKMNSEEAISGANDGSICMWDLNIKSSQNEN